MGLRKTGAHGKEVHVASEEQLPGKHAPLRRAAKSSHQHFVECT